MQKSTTAGRALAIAALAAFTVGGLYILLEQPVHTGNWSMHHALTVLIVFGTIASGHLCGAAWRSRSFSTIGFAILFVAGTGLVVYNSVGRQAATSAEVANTTVSANEKRAEVKVSLKTTAPRGKGTSRQPNILPKGQVRSLPNQR